MHRIFLFLLPVLLLVACDPNGSNQPKVDDFDRQAMLVNWADNLIIPAFDNLANATAELEIAAQSFAQNPTQIELRDLRDSWQWAYHQWQQASIYEIGKAEELRLRDNLNIYPVNVDELTQNISSGTYNLLLPSQIDRQGFPALDYLLYGVGSSEAEILATYNTDALATNYRQYVVDLATRINDLVQEVHGDWKNGYRNTFVENKGSNANASVDMLVNDFLFFYEKHLRAGKVGIPAGVFSGAPIAENVEAYYRRDMSRDLLLNALDAAQNFFNGDALTTSGPGLKAYLDYLSSEKEGISLSSKINDQFANSITAIQALKPDFVAQLDESEVPMLAAYDQLQLNVVLLKVDMLQALNINVDYVDADGD
ncbi:MAG: imelysin family protein [Bacteroidota bacterium]